jgi:Tfp pilus assembly protein PilO
MPFELSVKGNYDGMKNVVTALERSVRPIQIQAIGLTGGQNDLTMTITAQTYFQPQKSLKITTQEVK